MDTEKLYKALADNTRLRILNIIITSKSICVCQITAILKLNQSNISNHLDKLKQSGIIKAIKNNKFVYYQIDDNFIKEHKKIFEGIKASLEYLKERSSDIERLKYSPKLELGFCESSLIAKEIDKNIKQKVKEK